MKGTNLTTNLKPKNGSNDLIIILANHNPLLQFQHVQLQYFRSCVPYTLPSLYTDPFFNRLNAYRYEELTPTFTEFRLSELDLAMRFDHVKGCGGKSSNLKTSDK